MSRAAAFEAGRVCAGQVVQRCRCTVQRLEDRMSVVRRHKRQTASGKTATVRQYTRDGGKAAERRRDEAEERAQERWTPPPRAAAGETETPKESWWDDDVPRPEAWHDTGEDEIEHGGHTFKVNRAPAYKPQGDYDFADRPLNRRERFKARARASREMDEAQERFSYARSIEERDAAERDFEAARDRLNSIRPAWGD